MPRSEELNREQLLERQAFQLALMDRMRAISDPTGIVATATRALGEALDAGRCGYGVLCEDGSVARSDASWCGTLAPLTREARSIEAFGAGLAADLHAGRTVVIDDCHLDERTRDRRAAWDSIGTRSAIICPLMRQDRLDSIFFVHAGEPRQWTLSEISLAEDVAMRSRGAMERARGEAALRASEQRYRSLFNSIDAGFCVVEMKFGPDGEAADYRFVEVNDSFQYFTGIENAVGRWMREIAPDHEQHWFDLYGRVAKTGVPEQRELPAESLDDRWYLVHAYRVDDPARYHVAVLFTDLTERRSAERALERSREELELAARAAQLGRFDYRPQEDALTWDDRCRELFGISPGVPVTYDSAFAAGLHPDDRQRAEDAVAAALDPAGDHTFNVEYRTIGIEDGRLRHVIAHGLAFFAAGRPVRLVGTVQDVTRDREASAQLREVEERLRLAGRATNDAIWDWDFRTNHVIWNAGLQSAYGHRPADVRPVGEWWLEQIHPDDRDRIDRSIHEVIAGAGSDWADEYRFARADGSYADVLDRGYVLREDDGAPVRMVGAMLDVTARKAVERSLEAEVAATAAERDRAEEALRQSQKMEAVGQLTGGIAHDFNNLLTGISGALEMMQVRIDQGRTNELGKYSDAAMGAVRRAAALTHRLLAFSRRQTLDPKPIDANRLIAGIEELVRRTVGPQIEVHVSGKADLWTTLVDPNQLENAILNLCINARDAMPRGGRIDIEAANIWFDPAAARERDLDPGHYVSICVCDTGTGMSDEVAARAFDPFFTTKPIGEGTGLGLSMIYGFVRQSGGQVRIDTTRGKGTRMCLYLPRHESAPDAEDADGRPGAGPLTGQPARSGSVLVVDDEPTVRMLVVEVVEELGYAVLEAEDGPSAMRVLDAHPHIDLLITDVGLPGGMNGRQVADAALSRLAALKVIFITGYAENAVLGTGQLAPNMAVMTKPFLMEALTARVREIMD